MVISRRPKAKSAGEDNHCPIRWDQAKLDGIVTRAL